MSLYVLQPSHLQPHIVVGIEVVYADDLIAFLEQSFTYRVADKACASGD
jgi:hypothetical protein